VAKRAAENPNLCVVAAAAKRDLLDIALLVLDRCWILNGAIVSHLFWVVARPDKTFYDKSRIRQDISRKGREKEGRKKKTPPRKSDERTRKKKPKGKEKKKEKKKKKKKKKKRHNS
jgi:hypothetical protein